MTESGAHTRVRLAPWSRTEAGGYDLPAAALVRARARVGGVAAAMAGIYALGFGIMLWFRAWLLLGVYAAGFVLALGLVGLTRWSRLSHGRVLDCGLVFWWVCCGLDSVGAQWFSLVQLKSAPYLTWTTVYVVLFPLIVPAPPRRMVVAAVASAATVPAALGVWLACGLGSERVTGWSVLGASVNPGIAVAIAWWGSRAVHGITREAAVASELGSYRLQGVLGEGGMGTVYRARHRLLARPAAVKLLRAGQETDWEARFRKEAEVLAGLSSPHTVTLFDFGTSQTGAPYYVMELIRGVDLERLVERWGPQPPERVVFLLLQACDSLAEAHEQGLVHRDLKPANLMVGRRGGRYDFLTVLDFGLAQEAWALDPEGVTFGTPAYLAPELARGGRQADARSDVYALGCVAYFLLRGELVFEGADTESAQVRAHAEREAKGPGWGRALEVPPGLERLVVSCLAKDPSRRPASAEALAERLGALGLAEQWTTDRALRWWATREDA